MTSITLLASYIIAILLSILLVKIVRLLGKQVKKYLFSRKQIVSSQIVSSQIISISIIDVLEAILRVLCEVDRVSFGDSRACLIKTGCTTDNKIKKLITEIHNIIVNAKFGYCSKIPNLLYVQDRAIYENEWLKNWCKHPSNITKTYSAFLQIRCKLNLLSEIEQINNTDMKLIQDALKKIDMWLMSQTDHDISIIVT